jgi:hypothetical protein
MSALGNAGFATLAESCEHATRVLLETVASIDGLIVVGDPAGPLFAVATDENVPPEHRVDPHHWADQVRSHGWLLQLQPGFRQADGSYLPPTTHLTVTPVTVSVLPELCAILRQAADEVRGLPRVTASDVFEAMPDELVAGLANPDAPPLNAATAFGVLGAMGLAGGGTEGTEGAAEGSAGLPERMAGILAMIEALPAPLAETLLTELLARLIEPRD